MAKVIVERPRYGSSLPSQKKGYLKYLQTTAPDELPRRESMLGRWRGMQRSLNEHLGPMRRFLRSHVGRPWNNVHQELCEYVSFENAVQKHILTHVFDYVERDVALVDGRPAYVRGWRRGCLLAEGQMYVCPETGLLKIMQRKRPRPLPERIHVTPHLVHILSKGHWWEVRVQKVPGDADELWDVWLERRVSRLTKTDCIHTYGGEVFAISKRALSREETRQLLQRRRELGRRRNKRRTFWRMPCSE